jgi:hypothetical protein
MINRVYGTNHRLVAIFDRHAGRGTLNGLNHLKSPEIGGLICIGFKAGSAAGETVADTAADWGYG